MEISGTHQAEVARRMGIRPQSLNQYIQNRRCRPSLEWLLHFLQVNGAYLAIVFPTTGQYQDVVAKAAELEMTPLRWEMEFASQPDLPLEANPETNLESKLETKLETNLEPNLEPEAKYVVEDDGE